MLSSSRQRLQLCGAYTGLPEASTASTAGHLLSFFGGAVLFLFFFFFFSFFSFFFSIAVLNSTVWSKNGDGRMNSSIMKVQSSGGQ